MAITKTTTVMHNDVSVAAGGSNTSSAIDCTGFSEGVLSYKITNGATGPTVAGQVQFETSHDNSIWDPMGGPLQGGVANSGIYGNSGIRVAAGVKYVRATCGGNTGQAVVFRTTFTGFVQT